jgi:dethiobiotin synthetase
MSPRYFITGTDTDIGKTIVSTTLALGFNARYWKPIQTGSSMGTDSSFLSKWIGKKNIIPESYVFNEPVSPHLAAKGQGAEIDIARCLASFSKIKGPLIVEGAGGVIVPVNSKYTMADLIQYFDLPTIIVAKTQLGAINHSLLTVEALKCRGVNIAGIITIGDRNLPYEESIRQFSDTKVLGHLPFCRAFSETWFRTSFARLSMTNTQGDIHAK